MYLALAGAIDQFSLKSVTFFKYSRVVRVHMAIKKKKLALKQAPPPIIAFFVKIAKRVGGF